MWKNLTFKGVNEVEQEKKLSDMSLMELIETLEKIVTEERKKPLVTIASSGCYRHN